MTALEVLARDPALHARIAEVEARCTALGQDIAPLWDRLLVQAELVHPPVPTEPREPTQADYYALEVLESVLA